MLLSCKMCVLLTFLCINDAMGQWIFYDYNTTKAQAMLSQELFKNQFWFMPDNSRGRSYFSSRADCKKTGRLKVIPVLKLSKKFKEYDYTKDIRNYHEIDDSQF